jgi:hypothetical protein
LAFQNFFDKTGTILSVIDTSITQIRLTGDTYNSGNLYITGNTIIYNNLTLYGNTSLGNVLIFGDTQLDTLTAYNNAKFLNHLYIMGTGNTSLYTLYVSGSTNHNGILNVTGVTTLSTLNVTGNTNLNGLNNTGNTIHNGNLKVTGSTILAATTISSLNIGGNLNTTGNTIHNGNLIVTGNTTLYNLFITNDIGIGLTATTASLHIKSGNTAAGSAPIKFESGITMLVAEKGAVEYDSVRLFYSDGIPIRQTIIPSAYGEIYENKVAGTTITSTPAGGFIGWVTASSGALKLCSYVNNTAGNITGDTIKISSGGDGDYYVSFSATFTCSTTRVYTISIFKNNIQQTNLTSRIRATAATTYYSTVITGILTGLVTNDFIDVRVAGTNNNDAVILYDGNLSINRINR